MSDSSSDDSADAPIQPQLPPQRQRISVVAALIFRGGEILVQQRRAGARHALLWEFPGGKVESGETEQEALVRECREELGIQVSVGQLESHISHAYPDFDIELSLYRAEIIRGEVTNLQAADVRFVSLRELTTLNFTEADKNFVRMLAIRGEQAAAGITEIT